MMKTEIAGITRANEGIQGISWSILGQTYVPKSVTEHSFSWHATFPPETFVPPHIHPDQDEYLYILEGQLDFFLDGAETQGTPGDLVRLPMGKPHGIFNKSGRTAKTLFWVSPTRRHEGVGRERRMPREGMLANALRHIGLAKDAPGNSLDALVGAGDAGDFGLHRMLPPDAYLAGAQSLA